MIQSILEPSCAAGWPNKSRWTRHLGPDPLERPVNNATLSPAQSLDLLARAIPIQTEGNFTDARRFQLPYAFDDTLFSDRICPKSRPRVGDAIRPTLRRLLWASRTKLFCAAIWDIQRIGSFKACACSIAVSGKARLTHVVRQVGQRQNTGTDLIRFLEI